MIDLTLLRDLLADCQSLVEALDGQELNETVTAAESRHEITREEKRVRAERSKSLLLLAHRFALAEQMVLVEYHFARGEVDPLRPDREE